MAHSDSITYEPPHPLFEMEDGVLSKLYAHLNPRPVHAAPVAQLPVPVKPLHPILTREQTNLNYVLARIIRPAQSSGSIARLASVMYDEDVKNGSALFFAIEKLTDASVCDLIDINPDALLLFNSENRTPLMWAICKRRGVALIQYMVRANSAILTQQGDYGVPLVYGIMYDCTADKIKLLIDHEQTVLKIRHPTTHLLPVCRALQRECSLEVVQLLVYPDCEDIFDRPPIFAYPIIDTRPRNKVPLHFAVAKNDPSLEIVSYLVDLNEGALLLRNEGGQTALHIAIASRRIQNVDQHIVRFLVARCPQARLTKCHNLCTPLDLAVSRYARARYANKDWANIALFLRELVDDDGVVLMEKSPDHEIPLIKACIYDMVEPAVLRVLIGKHSPTILVCTDSKEQKTPLHLLAMCHSFMGANVDKQIEQVQMLSVDNIVLTMVDHRNNTPLHVAVGHGLPLAVLELLCADPCGGVLELPDHVGNIPLHIAAITEATEEVIRKLSGDKAKTCKMRNELNQAALDIAIAIPGVKMARISLFLHPNIDLRAKAQYGNTAVHTALRHGAHVRVIQHLLKLDPTVLAIKNGSLELPVTIALDAFTRNEVAQWSTVWSTVYIERLVLRTHTVDADAIPSCRSVLERSNQRSRYCGSSVLEVALRHGRALSVIKCIVKADPSVLAAYSPARAYSSSASRYYDANWHDDRVTQRATLLRPLHHALWYCAHPCVLKFLAEAQSFDNVLEWTDAFGNTALHMAIRQQKKGEDRDDGCDRETRDNQNIMMMRTLRYLVEAGEMSLLIQDEQGNTPLHMALHIGSGCNVLELLVEMSTPPPPVNQDGSKQLVLTFEHVFITKNVAQQTPLHLAVHERCDQAPLIMQAFPPAVLLRDGSGCNPMHTMASKHLWDISLSTVHELLGIYPLVLQELDILHRTPLQCALESMARERGQVTEETWLPLIRLLAGVSHNLLEREQTMRLMNVANREANTPCEYYRMHVRVDAHHRSCLVHNAPVVGTFLMDAQTTGGKR